MQFLYYLTSGAKYRAQRIKEVFAAWIVGILPWCFISYTYLNFVQTSTLITYLPMFLKQFSLASVFLPGLGV